MQRQQIRFFGGFLFSALLITTTTRGQNVVDLQNRLGHQLLAQLDREATAPASRGYDTMLYVSGSGPILMLGGEAHAGWSTGMTGNGGVWSLQPASGRWSSVSESVPLNSLDTSITYNTRVGRVIVFQSYVPNAQSKHILPIDFVSETWAYDPLTGSWENRHPAQSPPPGLLAGGTQIAYNWLWDKVVMFGGLDLVRFEEYLETCATACNNSLLPLIETNHTLGVRF